MTDRLQGNSDSIFYQILPNQRENTNLMQILTNFVLGEDFDEEEERKNERSYGKDSYNTVI